MESDVLTNKKNGGKKQNQNPIRPMVNNLMQQQGLLSEITTAN